MRSLCDREYVKSRGSLARGLDAAFTMKPSPAATPAEASPPIFAALAEALTSAIDPARAIIADVVLNNVFIIVCLRC